MFAYRLKDNSVGFSYSIKKDCECWEITEERHKELIDSQNEGYGIYSDKYGVIKQVKIPREELNNLVKGIFNFKTLKAEETATVQEQLEYYKQKIIECTKEIYIEESAGFKPSDELLQKKEHYSNLHMQISQPIALKINQHMDSTKPGTAQM